MMAKIVTSAMFYIFKSSSGNKKEKGCIGPLLKDRKAAAVVKKISVK